ncbi:MAG: single-stranded-DNA-specific exonuclease RecJ [Bacteroidetes bacterium]|nr:single-stranded-DNA-specific exonuclease RecJ [Bacteroidota bacterium]
MEKRWVVKSVSDSNIVGKLTQSLNIDPILACLLEQRGINSFSEAKDFFRPSLDSLHDPFLIKDMDKAIKRIEEAIANGERILIYGDYDVDGTTAVALVYSFLKEFHDNLEFYIPDREKEGYGISNVSIDYAKASKVSLIISLDCGIKAHKQISYAKEKGIDFIVCDHHRPGISLPDAVAIVDPKQPECKYPYDELSGCGLGFKLAQAFYHKRNLPFEPLEKLLDLVVVSIAADVVPITGENRILAYYGLKRLNLNPRPGFESILFYSNVLRKSQTDEQTVFAKEINVTDLVFLIGPRINAAGRIHEAKKAVELLICDEMKQTHELSHSINDNNLERRHLDSQITQEALKMITMDSKLRASKSTVLYHPDWHKGVIGIVASRLMETYYRPTVILTESNGVITGSARSVKDFDIYDAIDACSEYLDHFGGHKYAAGLSLQPGNFDKFHQKFKEYVDNTITEDMLIPEIEIDAEVSITQLNDKFFRVLKQFEPFGPGNTSPVFLATNLYTKGTPKIVGEKHLKFSVIQQGSSREFAVIAFQQAKHYQMVASGKPYDMVFSLEENNWNGQTSLQLNVKDLRFSM